MTEEEITNKLDKITKDIEDSKFMYYTTISELDSMICNAIGVSSYQELGIAIVILSTEGRLLYKKRINDNDCWIILHYNIDVDNNSIYNVTYDICIEGDKALDEVKEKIIKITDGLKSHQYDHLLHQNDVEDFSW